jgi:hypothetical protein
MCIDSLEKLLSTELEPQRFHSELGRDKYDLIASIVQRLRGLHEFVIDIAATFQQNPSYHTIKIYIIILYFIALFVFKASQYFLFTYVMIYNEHLLFNPNYGILQAPAAICTNT